MSISNYGTGGVSTSSKVRCAKGAANTIKPLG